MMSERQDLIKDYHGDVSSLSKTSLSMLLDRPSRYWKTYRAPPEARESFSESKCLREGDAVHCLVLEPEAWPCRYYVADATSRASKAFKDAVLFNLDRIVLTITEELKVRRMADAVLADPLACAYLQRPGKAETSFYWADESGISLKCRPDFLTDDSVYCVDLKTTKDIAVEAFTRDAFQYKFHVSAALSLAGVEAVRGIRPEAYVFVCVENKGEKRPDVAVYYMSAEGVELGQYELEKALDIYQNCDRSGLWPASSTKTEALKLPYYGTKKLEEYRKNHQQMELHNVS